MQAGWNEGVYGTGDFLRDALGYSRLGTDGGSVSFLVFGDEAENDAVRLHRVHVLLLRRGLILQDDYAARELASGLTQEYYFIRSLYTMVTGAGFLGAFWFMVCEYIGECRRSIRITPIVVYAALSLILLAISGESKVLRFCY